MSRDFSRARPGRPIPFAPPKSLDEKSNIFRVKGVFGGSISVVGPSCGKITGIPDATRIWKVTLSGSEGAWKSCGRRTKLACGFCLVWGRCGPSQDSANRYPILVALFIF
jgi:hypothetical protein